MLKERNKNTILDTEDFIKKEEPPCNTFLINITKRDSNRYQGSTSFTVHDHRNLLKIEEIKDRLFNSMTEYIQELIKIEPIIKNKRETVSEVDVSEKLKTLDGELYNKSRSSFKMCDYVELYKRIAINKTQTELNNNNLFIFNSDDISEEFKELSKTKCYYIYRKIWEDSRFKKAYDDKNNKRGLIMISELVI